MFLVFLYRKAFIFSPTEKFCPKLRELFTFPSIPHHLPFIFREDKILLSNSATEQCSLSQTGQKYSLWQDSIPYNTPSCQRAPCGVHGSCTTLHHGNPRQGSAPNHACTWQPGWSTGGGSWGAGLVPKELTPQPYPHLLLSFPQTLLSVALEASPHFCSLPFRVHTHILQPPHPSGPREQDSAKHRVSVQGSTRGCGRHEGVSEKQRDKATFAVPGDSHVMSC